MLFKSIAGQFIIQQKIELG